MEFYKTFAIVFNALDNVEARKHVNRMCMAAGKPLIESGTNGYMGNVTPILKGHTPCYECTPKVEGKTYPICTIRSTPSKMVHCVVWAKALYELLFGPYDDFNYLNDLRQKMAEIGTKDAGPWMKRLFSSDIVELAQCSKLSLKPVSEDCADPQIAAYKEKFANSFYKLVGKCAAFDKDNDDAVEFVYAASNLRAFNFSISAESQFKVKEIAGNIIAAISSTNATVAAIQVLEAVKLIENPELLRNVYVSNAQAKLVNSAPAADHPNPKVAQLQL